MNIILSIWKYSKLRFYVLNAIWNISFWLFCEKIYKNVSYKRRLEDFYLDEGFKMIYRYETLSKRRFVGYLYKGKMYSDNPGLIVENREVWTSWRKKGLL